VFELLLKEPYVHASYGASTPFLGAYSR
jgi:hypothetical protein